MTSTTTSSIDAGRLVMGLNLVLVGILCWLYQLGHLSQIQLFGFWPLALVGIGLSSLLGPERRPGVAPEGGGRTTRGGWGLVLIGVVLILGNLLMPDAHSLEVRLGPFPLRLSWPLVLMILGGYMVWRDRHPKERRSSACGPEDCCCQG